MNAENTTHGIDSAILAKAIEVFGSKEDAELGLRSSAMALDSQRPVDLLKSRADAKLVREWLERLEHGVYI